MKHVLATALIPPLSACRHACTTSCAAPVTLFWLFGVISVVYGLLGGPVTETGISWATVALGLTMWSIAATWTALAITGVEADHCHALWSPRDHHVDARGGEADPFEQINRAH